MNEEIQFLKDLQNELKSQENDCQASPRFWVIKDYRKVVGHEDYDTGSTEHFHNDGDHTTFKNFAELKVFIEEYFEEDVESDEELQQLLSDENESFYELWDYVESNLNDDGYFSSVFMKEESYLVPNTMFLTKEEAKRHLKLNNYHYSPKAHTYAMTAWRAPKVERLLKLLETFDWDSIKVLEKAYSDGTDYKRS
jgi:hypothetical protein